MPWIQNAENMRLPKFLFKTYRTLRRKNLPEKEKKIKILTGTKRHISSEDHDVMFSGKLILLQSCKARNGAGRSFLLLQFLKERPHKNTTSRDKCGLWMTHSCRTRTEIMFKYIVLWLGVQLTALLLLQSKKKLQNDTTPWHYLTRPWPRWGRWFQRRPSQNGKNWL